MMKGIEITLPIKVVKYTVEGRSGFVKAEVVELICKVCVRLWMRFGSVVEEIFAAILRFVVGFEALQSVMNLRSTAADSLAINWIVPYIHCF